ncbi:SPFH domain-containing protein [Brevibacterium sp. CFH 10365]|uniref:SPFH domain-containing protein n=1 Tax=Brevibacterium sp. CFH 10365 TaxID=2585207 RepID=UPI001D0D3BEC|nr:SPFH domain-containing protein [Brevibacterium sp. CFH 10365]
MTILIGALLIIGLLVLAGSKLTDRSDEKRIAKGVGAALLAVGVIVGAVGSTTVVQPRTVGVKVALGKPTGVVGNGFHAKAPWEKVEKLDGSVQNDVYAGDSSISVRLGNNSRATVDASIQWQLKTDEAMQVFLDYKTFEGIQSNLVDRNFRTALNEAFAEYDPLNYSSPEEGGKALSDLSVKVQENMEAKVGKQIEVRSVSLPLIAFDEATQKRIDDLQSESAKTRVANQKKETSKAEAEANETLERSVTDKTLTSKCLDIVAESGQSPIGCFPGNSASPVKILDDK